MHILPLLYMPASSPRSPRDTLRLIVSISKFALTYHLFTQWVGHYQLTDGPSMLPTLNARGDYVWINCLHRRGRGIRAGDVISFRHPLSPGDRASKRVIAMPGDFVGRDTPGVGSDVMIQVCKHSRLIVTFGFNRRCEKHVRVADCSQGSGRSRLGCRRQCRLVAGLERLRTSAYGTDCWEGGGEGLATEPGQVADEPISRCEELSDARENSR